MEKEYFKFKEFKVSHSQSSMKVGVDAVLIGCWAGKAPKEILEVGCGCGVISLILAQRFSKANILAIDIDNPSVEECKENFENSPWKNRLKVELKEFSKNLILNNKFDLIISNPPFYRSGIDNPVSRREIARHQSSLSVFSLLHHSSKFLNVGGTIAMIFPTEFLNETLEKAKEEKFYIRKICRVRNNVSKEFKRVLLELSKDSLISKEESDLTMFENGEPTEEYINLCKDFYLKF